MEIEQLAQVIAAYGPDILRFCRITVGSSTEGDELYQDTMLTLLERQKDLDASQNVKSYALSVAVKPWKNRQRKLARRLHLVPQESLDALIRQLPQRYRLDHYKFVPEDYELTPEDEAMLEQPGYYLSYGSDTVTEQDNHSLSWVKDGVSYHLLDSGAKETPDALFAMAEELILAE